MCACVCVRACVCACLRVCACVRVSLITMGMVMPYQVVHYTPVHTVLQRVVRKLPIITVVLQYYNTTVLQTVPIITSNITCCIIVEL